MRRILINLVNFERNDINNLFVKFYFYIHK